MHCKSLIRPPATVWLCSTLYQINIMVLQWHCTSMTNFRHEGKHHTTGAHEFSLCQEGDRRGGPEWGPKTPDSGATAGGKCLMGIMSSCGYSVITFGYSVTTFGYIVVTFGYSVATFGYSVATFDKVVLSGMAWCELVISFSRQVFVIQLWQW